MLPDTTKFSLFPHVTVAGSDRRKVSTNMGPEHSSLTPVTLCATSIHFTFSPFVLFCFSLFYVFGNNPNKSKFYSRRN